MPIPLSLLACPRCDKTPLDDGGDHLRCKACDIDFPSIDGIPWLFAEPPAALGEWRARLQFALLQLGHEISGVVVAGDAQWVGKEVIVPAVMPDNTCPICAAGRNNRC